MDATRHPSELNNKTQVNAEHARAEIILRLSYIRLLSTPRIAARPL